jgi:nucleoside-diphosphate-sugar epimerase
VLTGIIRRDLVEIVADTNIDWEQFNGAAVLITGAYGMLPSYMVWTLIYLNETRSDFLVTIMALGRSEEKFQKRFGIYAAKPYLRFYQQDLSEPLKSVGPCDFVIHGASPASPHVYGTAPLSVIPVNVNGTYHTLDLAHQSQSCAYLLFSSSEIYGIVSESVVTEDNGGLVNPLDVRSCYAESKRVAENLCVCAAHQWDVPAKIVRISHTFGPTINLENDERSFASFVAQAVAGNDIVMQGDGSAMRSFCYITDAVRAYFLVLLKGDVATAYNVGNPYQQHSIKELAHMAAAHASKQIIVRGGGLIQRIIWKILLVSIRSFPQIRLNLSAGSRG